jgi:large conductance mechanosensitive channel
MLKEFRKFILRGNVVDLAVGVVVGVAFSAVVSSLVKDLLTPLIAAIVGKTDFSNLTFTLHHSQFLYGDFINALVSFLSIAIVVFFFVVEPVNRLVAYSNRNKVTEETEKKCPHCISSIPKEATKCKFCTSTVK